MRNGSSAAAHFQPPLEALLVVGRAFPKGCYSLRTADITPQVNTLNASYMHLLQAVQGSQTLQGGSNQTCRLQAN